MKIALLTGGGDCSGLNAAIRAVVRKAISLNHRVVGILEGWNGLVEKKTTPLTLEKVSGILPLGGTILGGARINPLKNPQAVRKSELFFKKQKFDVLISIGGEGTLKIAAVFAKRGMPIVCIPKTIDNDLWGTDYTIGFDTAVQVVTEAIDRLHTTAESHSRIMIIEVMGRHAGWIAAYAGIAGGADAILAPEELFKIDDLCKIVKRRAKRGRKFSIFVVSEDAKIHLGNRILKTSLKRDEYGDIKLGGIGELLAKELRKRTDSEVRVTVLGHLQRGGTPTAFDRVLATRLGVAAVELIEKGEFGKVVVLRGNQIESIPILEGVDQLKTLDPEILKIAQLFFG